MNYVQVFRPDRLQDIIYSNHSLHFEVIDICLEIQYQHLDEQQVSVHHLVLKNHFKIKKINLISQFKNDDD